MEEKEPDVLCQIAFPYKRGKDIYYPGTLDGESYMYNLTATLNAAIEGSRVRMSELLEEVTIDELTSGCVMYDDLPEAIQTLIGQFVLHARELVVHGDPDESKKLRYDGYIVTFQLDDESVPGRIQ